jgi:hypothetical protein
MQIARGDRPAGPALVKIGKVRIYPGLFARELRVGCASRKATSSAITFSTSSFFTPM